MAGRQARQCHVSGACRRRSSISRCAATICEKGVRPRRRRVLPVRAQPDHSRMGASAMERLFRFLFKYPPLMFQQGDFSWGLSRPVLLVVAAGTATAVLALLTYRGVSATDRARDRVVLVGLRDRKSTRLNSSHVSLSRM